MASTERMKVIVVQDEAGDRWRSDLAGLCSVCCKTDGKPLRVFVCS